MISSKKRTGKKTSNVLNNVVCELCLMTFLGEFLVTDHGVFCREGRSRSTAMLTGLKGGYERKRP